MDTLTVKPPPGFVLDTPAPPAGFVLDDGPAPPAAESLGPPQSPEFGVLPSSAGADPQSGARPAAGPQPFQVARMADAFLEPEPGSAVAEAPRRRSTLPVAGPFGGPHAAPKENLLEKTGVTDIGAAIKMTATGTTPYGPEYDAELADELYKRLSWWKTYAFSLGGRIGPKTLREELLKEASEFKGFGPALAPLAGDAAKEAVEWGFLYPKLFKLSGGVGKAIGGVPRVKAATEALAKAGGLTKLAEKHPALVNAAEQALKSFGKGFATGATVQGAELIGKDQSALEAIDAIATRGTQVGGVAAVFSAASSADTALFTRKLRKEMIAAVNHRYNTKLAALPKRTVDIPIGQEVVRYPGQAPASRYAAKTLGDQKQADLRRVDDYVADIAARLDALKAGKMYREGQEDLATAMRNAQRFARKGFDPGQVTPKPPAGYQTPLGRSQPFIKMPATRAGEAAETAREFVGRVTTPHAQVVRVPRPPSPEMTQLPKVTKPIVGPMEPPARDLRGAAQMQKEYAPAPEAPTDLAGVIADATEVQQVRQKPGGRNELINRHIAQYQRWNNAEPGSDAQRRAADDIYGTMALLNRVDNIDDPAEGRQFVPPEIAKAEQLRRQSTDVAKQKPPEIGTGGVGFTPKTQLPPPPFVEPEKGVTHAEGIRADERQVPVTRPLEEGRPGEGRPDLQRQAPEAPSRQAPSPAEEVTQSELKKGQPFKAKVYRGQGKSFEEIYGPGAEGPILGTGTYWSQDPQYAKYYGDEITEGEVELKNPYVLKNDDQLWGLMDVQGEIPWTNEERSPLLKNARKKIEQAGYDGVVVQVPQGTDMDNEGNSMKRLREMFGHDQIIDFKAPQQALTPASAPAEKTPQVAPGATVEATEPSPGPEIAEQAPKVAEQPPEIVLHAKSTPQTTEQWKDINVELRKQELLQSNTWKNATPANLEREARKSVRDARPGSKANLSQWVRALANEVPEFAIDPVFTADKDKMLIFQDGGRYKIHPRWFGLDQNQLQTGQSVRLDPASFKIKRPSARKLAKERASGMTAPEVEDQATKGRRLEEAKPGKPAAQPKVQPITEKPKPAVKKGGRPGFPGTDSPRRIKVSMEPKGKVTSAREVIDFAKRAFNIAMRGKATHKMRSYLGWYDPHAVGIRLKDVRGIATAVHEIGHYLDWHTNDRWSKKPGSKAIADELMKLGKDLYGDTKPPGGYKSEGWAEFTREYLTGEEAEIKAPNLHKWFTQTYLKNNPDVAKNLAKLKGMIESWRFQGAEARVESQINRRPIKGTIMERIAHRSLWFDTMMRDELAPLRVRLKQAGIKDLKPSEDPVALSVAYADKAPAKARHFVMEYTTDLAGNRTGPGLREILKPVRKDIETFTRWIVAKRALHLWKRGINPGMSQGDAQYVYDQHHSDAWEQIASDVTEWNHRLLDYLHDSGAMETAALAKIKKMNPIYVPFMRAFAEGEVQISQGTGKGIAKVGKPVKAIKGSGREIVDPLEAMIQQAERIFSTAHKSMVARSLAKLAQRPGMAAVIWKVPPPSKALKFSAEQLKKDILRIARDRLGLDPEEISSGMMEEWDEILTVYYNASQYYGKDNIVSLVTDGKRQFYEVDPDVYRVMEGLDQYSLPWLASVLLGKPTRALRLGATGLNASFGLVRNFIRDAMTFSVLAKHAKMGPLSATAGVVKDMARTAAAQQFKALGGKMSSQILQDRRATQNLRSEVVEPFVVRTVLHPIDALRELFGVTEAGVRIAEFDAALKAGEKKYGKGSLDAALYALNQAQDVTTNFTRHGRVGKILNQMIAFFNAAIQGPDKIQRTFRERPVRTTLMALAALTVPAILLWWRNKDEDWYKKLDPREKARYLHFRVPGGQTIVRIPIPFELGHIFQSIPVAALDARYNKDPDEVKRAFAEAAKDANPFDWPACIGPLIDVKSNKDWAGNPIVTQSMARKLPEDQYKPWTTQLMRQVGKTLGASPAQIEYLVNSYSGGLFGRIVRTVENGLNGPKTPSDWPVVGTLFLRESYRPNRQIDGFYAALEHLNAKDASDKTTRPEKMQLRRLRSIERKLSPYWKRLRKEDATEQERKQAYAGIERWLKIAARSRAGGAKRIEPPIAEDAEGQALAEALSGFLQ